MYILLITFRTGKFSNELSVLCHLSYLRPFRYEFFLQPFWQAALWACETAWISYVTGIKAAFLFLTHRGRKKKKKKTSQEKSSKLRSCCSYCKCKQANWIMIKYGAIDRSSVWANISRLYLRLDMVSELLASISLPKQTCKGTCWPRGSSLLYLRCETGSFQLIQTREQRVKDKGNVVWERSLSSPRPKTQYCWRSPQSYKKKKIKSPWSAKKGGRKWNLGVLDRKESAAAAAYFRANTIPSEKEVDTWRDWEGSMTLFLSQITSLIMFSTIIWKWYIPTKKEGCKKKKGQHRY